MFSTHSKKRPSRSGVPEASLRRELKFCADMFAIPGMVTESSADQVSDTFEKTMGRVRRQRADDNSFFPFAARASGKFLARPMGDTNRQKKIGGSSPL